MEIFKLMGSVFIDNSKADQALDQTDKKGGGLAKTFGTVAKGAAIVGGAALVAGGAIIGLASKAGDAADRLLDLNSITGMSTGEIQRWEKATKVAGVSVDAVTNASQMLTKTMDIIATGTGKASKSANKLGLSYETLSAMNADERMNAVTQALAGVEDKTERARMGTDLLGGSWKEIAPIVDLGAEAMGKAKDSANIISEEDLKKANDFRIKMEEMKDQASHFAIMLGVKVIPIAEKLFDWVSQYMPQIQAVMKVVFDAIAILIDDFIKGIGFIIDWIKQWASDNQETIDGIKKAFATFFDAVKVLITTFIGLAVGYWKVYGDEITAIVGAAFDIVANIFDTVLNTVTNLFNIFSALFRGDWEGLWDGVKSFFLDIWSGIYKGLKGIINLILAVINPMVERIGSTISNGFNGAISFITGLPSKAYGWGRDFIQGLINGIRNMIGGITSAVTSVGDKIKSFLHFSTPDQGPLADYENWMPDFMSGLAEGIEKSKYLVANAVAGLSTDMSIGMNLTPRMAGMGMPSTTTQNRTTETVTNSVVVQNMYVRNDQDIKLVARELYNLQQQASRGRGLA